MRRRVWRILVRRGAGEGGGHGRGVVVAMWWRRRRWSEGGGGGGGVGVGFGGVAFGGWATLCLVVVDNLSRGVNLKTKGGNAGVI